MKRLLGLALIGSAFVLLPAQINFYPPINAPTINGSATIANGGSFQLILAAAVPSTAFPNPRHSLTIQNNNGNTDNCYVTFGSFNGTPITAGNAQTSQSILLPPGGSFQRYYPFVPVDALFGMCQGTNDTIYLDTQ